MCECSQGKVWMMLIDIWYLLGEGIKGEVLVYLFFILLQQKTRSNLPKEQLPNISWQLQRLWQVLRTVIFFFFLSKSRLVNLNQNNVLLSHHFHPSFWSTFQLIYFRVSVFNLGPYGHHTLHSERHYLCLPQDGLNSSPHTQISTTQFSPFPCLVLVSTGVFP